FTMRGADVDAELHGGLHLAVRNGQPTLVGLLEAYGGWVELFGRKMTIDHARISFQGRSPIEPSLDGRLTRPYGDTTLIADVTGPSRSPTVALSSDPPTYAPSEIVGLLLSGEPGNTGTLDERSLEQKTVGALSSVVVSKLKQELVPGLPID